MESILVSEYSIISNLRRTSSKGLFSCLSQHQLNDLALKYFGIYDNNKLVGYECPYSGKKITSTEDIVLEHIIPVSSGGGTALFNCIPTSVEVNKVSEKGVKHLISWWLNSKYWNSSASVRLEKIIEYMLDAYEITFINGDELSDYDDFDYDEDENNNDLENQEGDLSTTQEEEQNVNIASLITYYNFINELIDELKKYKDVTIYQNRLQNLINQNIFGNIERQTLIQNSLKDIIKNRLELEDRSELTLLQKIDIYIMTKSLENILDDNIYSELEQRMDNLDIILQNNNLSLNSLFMDRNSLNYLYKSTSDLTEEDIKELVENINMCVADKFNAMIQFIKDNKGDLPKQGSNNKQEQQLAKFLSSIKSMNKKTGKFNTQLTENQLKYLHDSEYKSLRDVYKEILFKATENDILIEYVDDEMASKIREYNELLKNTNSVEEQIKLENKYRDYIIIESQFNHFIDFVLNIEPKGKLPSRLKDADENEQQLAYFIHSIKSINKKRGKFSTQLTKNQLKYLHDSEYKSLRDVYKEILFKATENDILIEYVDEEMASKIREYNELLKNSNSIENQIELERKYADYIIIESQFNHFIDFVLNIEPKGKLPSQSTKVDESEQQLAKFLSSIKSMNKKTGKFIIQLTKNQLKYLHDSEYKSLRDVYKEILFKVIENDIEIEYVDEEMASKIREYNELLKNSNSIENQIELERKYADYIIIESQFNHFIDFVLNIEPKGKLPSRLKDADENEQQLAYFILSIKSIKKKTGKFNSQLTQEQLRYLHDSEYESLRDIYKEILFKAIENDILIEYVDEEMESKIREYNELLKNSNSIENQIELERKYADYIIIESQFNHFIDFVLNIEPKGKLPSRLKDADENEQQLAHFFQGIKSIDKKKGKFKTQLTKEQLRYLHDSEYESLRKIYDEIIEKAIAIHYQPYIEVDNELKNSRKGKVV